MPVARGPAGLSSLPEMLIVVVGVDRRRPALMARIRFPGGLLFGAMAGSGVLHGTGLVQAVLPWWIGSAAVIVLGAVVGSRFADTTPAADRRLSRRCVRFIRRLADSIATLFVLIVTATSFRSRSPTWSSPFRPARRTR